MKIQLCRRMRGRLLLIAVVFTLLMPGVYAATENKADVSFDPSVKYDIYFSEKNGNLNGVKDARALEIKVIQGSTFLVFLNAGIKPEKGYIRIENLVAVLPAETPLNTQCK